MDLFSFYLSLLSLHILLLGSDADCPSSFACGGFSLDFPFTKYLNPGCGLILVDGCDSYGPITISGPAGNNYTILEKISSKKFLVQDTQLLDFFKDSRTCLRLRNLSATQTYPLSFTYSPTTTLFTCFNQTPDDQIQGYFTNYSKIKINDGRSHCPSDPTVYYSNGIADDPPDMEVTGIPSECSMIQLPLTPNGDSDDLVRWSTPNFTLEWSVPQGCVRSHIPNAYDCEEGGIIC